MVKGRFENILVLGIERIGSGRACCDGSSIETFLELLSEEQRNGMPRIFFLIISIRIRLTGFWSVIDLEKTLVNVITKSGSTAENNVAVYDCKRQT